MVTDSRVITEGTVSNVSANEVETSENCSQALESINTDDPLPADETSTKTEFLSPIPQSDEVLNGTAMVVASKSSSQRADGGPS